MANEVFANGRELSCKAGDAKSICEFPDVCFTPPQTPATPPGVPIPYPNTGMSKDTTKGSKKVKISKKEIMLKNKSYYKKSMGDEAGCAPKKGIISSTNRGKVYFISWSFDVKFEGKNVVRQLDMTTHNHNPAVGTGSVPTVDVDGVAVAAPAADDKCTLKPYKDGCDGGKTPHHCVPDHCFKEKGKDGEYYPGAVKHSEGLCICVSGSTKSTTPSGGTTRKKDHATEEKFVAALAEHGRIHHKFDKLERELGNNGDPKNTATIGDLEDKAAEVIAEVTGCDKGKLKKQMRDYHQGKGVGDSTKLRADPFGRRKNPPKNVMGTGNGTAGAASR
ncbi:MAG: DUF4150 domain-containing protein [Candidatus Thiodiazotropha taylori]|nr:DUF4150 domain-containing protein [Candidatus Thiodiazotropha taylori]